MTMKDTLINQDENYICKVTFVPALSTACCHLKVKKVWLFWTKIETAPCQQQHTCHFRSHKIILQLSIIMVFLWNLTNISIIYLSKDLFSSNSVDPICFSFSYPFWLKLHRFWFRLLLTGLHLLGFQSFIWTWAMDILTGVYLSYFLQIISGLHMFMMDSYLEFGHDDKFQKHLDICRRSSSPSLAWHSQPADAQTQSRPTVHSVWSGAGVSPRLLQTALCWVNKVSYLCGGVGVFFLIVEGEVKLWANEW